MFDRLYGTQNPTPLDSDAKKDTRGLKRRLFGSDNDGDYAVAVSPPRLKRQVTARKEGLRSQRLLDQDESGQRPRSPIRRKQYSVAPMLTRYQARRSPSPPVEHRLASRLESRYEDLANEHYAKAIKELQKSQAELAAEADDATKSEFQKLSSLMNRSAQLHAPLSNEDAEYSARGADGSLRAVTIPISEAIASFEKRLEGATARLTDLWASWDEARVEIESLCDINGSGHDDDGWKDLMELISGETKNGAALLDAELEELAEQAAEEYKKQEKNFIKRLGDEGCKVVANSMF